MNPKPINLMQIRQADELMREAIRLNPHVRIPTLSDLERMLPMAKTKEKIPGTPGRPPGAEPTVSIALRIPQSMCNELDAQVERLEAQTGLKASRTSICRRALQLYLEEQPILSKPKVPAPKRTRTPAKTAKG